MTISIIDDDQTVREATGDLVQSLGYDVLTFESAERFLESGRLAETSCLITDLHKVKTSYPSDWTRSPVASRTV